MKKFLLILLVPMMLLAGCESEETTDFLHKKTCERYYNGVERITKNQANSILTTKYLDVYWSEAKNACVTIIYITYSSDYGAVSAHYEYYDAATNTLLWSSAYKSNEERNYYENSLQLLK